jgi:glycosyltransferase involved in cell wall biosynthesis
MINLHITLNSFLNASRVLKESESLLQSGLVKKIFIVALYENGLQEYEKIGYHRTVWRVKLETRNMPKLFIFQALKYFEFCLRVFFFSKKNNVDIVNVHSLSLLPLGVWLKIRQRAKLVYDTHELETETNGLTGFRKSVSKIVERGLIRFADLTIVVGGEIEKWYKNKYGIYSIVKILNCPRYQVTERSQLLREEFDIPVKKKIVLYQGGLSAGRGIELLLDAFENSYDDRYVIIFMGNGPLAMAVRIAEGR